MFILNFRFHKHCSAVLILTILASFFLSSHGSSYALKDCKRQLKTVDNREVFCIESKSDGSVNQSQKKDEKPFIELIAPNGGEVWIEGRTYGIRWRTKGVDEVLITVAVGGKDKGYLGEGKALDAQSGKFEWEIPVGFVTGFGVSHSERVRMLIHDVHDRDVFDISNDYFAIVGAQVTSVEEKAQEAREEEEYKKAIARYYQAIASQEYREAFDMLSQCKVVLTNADGSAVAFQPRDDYDSWQKAQKNINRVSVIEVKRIYPQKGPQRYTADMGSAEAILDIRTYMVKLDIELLRESWTISSGQNTFFIAVVKGTDGKIRILGIGTGP